MSSRTKELRLGIAFQGGSVQFALVDGAHALVKAMVWQRTGSFAEDLDLALREAPSTVKAIMIVSDDLRDALDQDSRLARVAALRIGGPVATGIPVLARWPESLIERISPITAIVGGAVNESGNELAPFDAAAAERFFERCIGEVDAVAISSVFAPLDTGFERRAAEIAVQVLGESIPVTVSHSVAGFGLLDRENAAILNAALTPLASEMLAEIDAALAKHRLEAEVFLGQNDGMLSVVDIAVLTPIRLLEGVAAAEIYGAGLLAGAKDAVVTSDGLTRGGVLRDGFVVMSSVPTWVAGTRMNIELPVGAGGTEPPPSFASSASEYLSIATEVSDTHTGVPNAEVAAAYGAALAPVGATTWVVSQQEDDDRFRLLQAEQHVVEMAIISGADPSTVAVRDTDSTRISFSNKRRLRIRATGRPMFVSRTDRDTPELSIPYSIPQ